MFCEWNLFLEVWFKETAHLNMLYIYLFSYYMTFDFQMMFLSYIESKSVIKVAHMTDILYTVQ